MANGLPDYLSDTAKDYATQSTAAYKTALQPSTFMGPQFVAGEDPLQTKAIDAAQAGIDDILLIRRHERLVSRWAC